MKFLKTGGIWQIVIKGAVWQAAGVGSLKGTLMGVLDEHANRAIAGHSQADMACLVRARMAVERGNLMEAVREVEAAMEAA